MASVLPEKVDVAFEEQRFGVLRPRSKTRHKRSMDGDESGAKHAPVQAQGSRRPRSISMGTRTDRTHELMYVPPFVQRAETGERVRLTSLWENCKAVVGFLRHFGCRSCWRDAAYLNSLKPTLDKHGVKLIAIAIGSTAQACAFKQDTKFEGDLYVDDIPSIAPNAEFPKFDPEKLPVAAEELKSTPGIQRSTDGYAGHETQMTKPTDASYAYASFRLKRSTNIVYRETVLEFVQPPDAAFKDLGHYGGTEARWPADFLQLGGLFVLGPGNHCDYAYRSYYVGDFPLDGEVLTAATGVKPEGQSFLFPSTQGWVDKLNMDTVVDPSPPTKSESAAPEPIATPVPPPPVIAKKSEAVDPPAVAVEPLPSATSLFNALPVPFHLSMLLSGLVLIVSVWAKDHSVVRAFIAALSVFAVYLVTLLQSAPKSQQSPATSATPPAAEEKPVEDEPLTFFTPREIDEMVLAARASGKFEDCECSDVMGRIPMNLRLEPRPAPSTNQAIKENPSDSDDSDLSDSSDDLSRRSLSNLSKLVDQLEKASSYEIRVYQTTLCYVREFLAKPHPLVGRPGPTCPFVPKSLRLNSINIRVIRTGVNPSVERMKQIALGCIPQFEALHPRTGRLSLYKAIILVFPDIPLEDAPRLIDGVQRALKPSFVAKGMMVGEFHLKNNCPGLRNSKFFPLRTPYPSLAMRNMVPSDLVFLTMDQYEPQTRVSFLESYIRTLSSPKDADEDAGMADATPGAIGASKELAIAKEELEKVRQQIANGA